MSSVRLLPRVFSRRAVHVPEALRARIFSTAAATLRKPQTSIDIKADAQLDVRLRHVDGQGDSVELGFTDGTAYRFNSLWLRSMVTGFAPEQMLALPHDVNVSSAHLADGASSVVLHWASDSVKRSTFDANMLRAFADEVASPVCAPTDLSEPVRGPAVWTGADLAISPWWGVMLSDEDIDDLVKATATAMEHVEWRAPGVPEAPAKEHFPLGPSMTAKLAGLSDEIEFGKGLAMVRNMPVDDARLSDDDLALMYLGVSVHIGHVVMQSSSGLRSVSRGYGMPLGRVQAEMTGETPKGGKQTNNHFRLHTDRCDVISLMSLRTAPTGGASRVCSAPAVYNAILERSPELAKALTEPIDRIWEGENGYFRLPVLGLTPTGQFTTQISPSYVENAQFLPAETGAVKASEVQVAALDAIEEVGMELGAEFVMRTQHAHNTRGRLIRPPICARPPVRLTPNPLAPPLFVHRRAWHALLPQQPPGLSRPRQLVRD